MKYPLLILINSLLFFYTNCIAQEICVDKIYARNNTDVFSAAYAIETDSLGYTYIATDNGIFYFDGKYLKKYTKSPYEYVDIINFYNDYNRNIWALPYYGKIFVLNNNKQKEINFFNNENYKTYYAFTAKDSSIHFYLEFQNISYTGILKHDGTYYVYNNILLNSTYYNEFFKKNISDKKQTEKLNNLILDYSTSQIRIKNNKFFIRENKLYFLDSNKINLIFDGDNFNCQQTTIVDFYQNKNNGYYLALMGKKNGLYYFSNKKIFIPIYTQSGVNGITKDNKGNILFIDKKNKLLKIENIHFTKEKIQFGPNNKIQKIVDFPNRDTVIISDNNGILYYFNTYNSKINKINIQTSQNSYLEQFENQIIYLDNDKLHLFFPEVMNIHFSKNYKYSFNNKTVLNEKINLPFFIFKNNILFASILNENIYLFFKNYLYVYDIKQKSYTQINYSFKLNFIENTNNGDIKLNTDKGLFLIESNKPHEISQQHTLQKSNNLNLLNHKKVNNINYYISRKYIYKLVKNKIFIDYIFEKNRSSFDIVGVANYKHNLIIIGHQGFEIFNTKTKKLFSYTLPYLETNETLIGSFIKDDDVYFYSNEYLYSCPMEIFDLEKNIPKINFSNISYNNNSANIKNDSLVENFIKKNYLHIEFDAINSIFNNENKFYYSLYDRSNNHVEISKTSINNNQMSLSNINYGSYDLFFYYDDILVKKIFINYIPKWYQTSLFYIEILLLCFIGTFYLTYYLIKNHFKRKRIKLEEKNYQYRLESSSMLNQLKPHFIFNALTPIQNYILTKRNDEALKYLDNFSTLIRSMLNMSRDSSTTLSNEIKFIENYLTLKFDERSENFKYEIISDFSLEESMNIKIPTLLLQPLVENAITYGKDYIKIHFINDSENLIRVVVSDNGNGFDLEKVLNNKNKKNHALQIISERIALLKKESGLPTILKTYFKDNLFEVKICIPKIK